VLTRRSLLACPALLGLLAALAGALPAAARAAPAPVPCDPIGGGRYACDWYVPGDGRTAGASVVRGGRVVGYLHQGRNWITCQQRGADVRNAAGDRNHWYGWTLSDAGPNGNQWGWASALEARGGDDYGPFRGVPDCRGAHGAAPTVAGLWPPRAPAPPRPAVNPAWAAMYSRAFGAMDPRDRRVAVRTAGRNSDDGLVVVRFFIPTRIAAGLVLLGDGRGFTPEPFASSRAVLAWDTETGWVSFAVTHSTLVNGSRDDALPILRLPREPVWSARDVPRRDNRVWLSAAPSRVDVRMSVVNSVTNQWRLGAWSVDNDLTVFRGARGGYSLQINGNGYPAVEVYYYPRYGTEAPHTVARRVVQPFYRGKPPDAGGGAAALDRLSWSNCTQREPRSLFCDSARGPWGAPAPESRLDWLTTW
jgi:hypothetical protein